MAPFWSLRGYWTRGRTVIERALRDAPGSALAALALVELGSLARLQGDDDAARSSFERAHEMAESHGAAVVSIAARAGLARLLTDRGDHIDAQAVIAELLSAALRLDAPALVCDLLADAATSDQYLGDLASSRERYAEAAAIARSLGDLHRAADLEGSRGTVAFIEGDVETARALFEEQLRLAHVVRDSALVATATSYLASCASRDGDHDLACTLYEQSLEIFRRLGHQWRVALTLSELAQATAQAGDIEAGRVLLQQSLDVAVRCGFHLIQAESLHKLALFAHAQGDRSTSARTLADAIRICREHGDTLRTVLLVEHAAVLSADSGRATEAIVLAAAADAQRRRIGFPRHRLPVLEGALERAASDIGDEPPVEAERRGAEMSMSDAVTAAIELCVELIDG
jgi:tetratricopeptide (TPR) repeat protein